MATRLHLDTHAVVWLHSGELEKFSPNAKRDLERFDLVCSPIVQLELQYLLEIGRLTTPHQTILDDLRQDIGLQICSMPYLDVIKAACLESWTRDPFDRTIVAQARTNKEPLLTRDRKITEHYAAAFW